MSARSRVFTGAAGVAVLLWLALAAWAYMTATGTGSGFASTATLASPAVAASSPSNGDANVSWTAVASPAGTSSENAEVTYFVERATSATGPWSAANNTCSGTLASTILACDDMPSAGGTYYYRVTAHFRSWTSAGVSNSVVVVTDATAPTATISFPIGGTAYKASSYNAGCSPTGICGAASDASGVASLRVSIKRNSDATYWNGSAFSGTTETFNAATLTSPNAASTSWSYSFALPSDGSFVIHVQATDTFGNAETGTTYAATSAFTVDTVPPVNLLSLASSSVGAFLNGTTLYYKSDAAGSFRLVNAVSDANSGPASATFPSLTGTNWTTHASESVSTPAGGPYTSSLFQWSAGAGSPSTTAYTATDKAGNTNTGTSLTFTADSTAPTGTITSPSAGNVAGTVTLQSSTATDTGSGVASVAYYYCSGTCATNPPGVGWTLITTSTAGPTWTGSWDASAIANGPYTLKAVITDNVGNQVATSGVSVTNLTYTFTIGSVGTQTAGTAFGGFTVQLQKNGSNSGTYLGSSYSGSHTLTLTGTAWANAPDGTAPTPSSLTLSFDSAGLATVPSTITIFKAGAGVVLTATDTTNSIAGTSNSFNISAASATKLAWTGITTNTSATSSPNPCLFTCTYASGFGNSKTWTANISVTDNYGNVVSGLGSGHTVTVTLGGSAGQGTLNNNGVPTSVTLTIASTGAATSTSAITFKGGTGSSSWTNTLSATTAAGTVYSSASASFTK